MTPTHHCHCGVRETSKSCPTKKFTVPHQKDVKSIFSTTTPPNCAQNTAAMKLNVKNIRYLAPEDWRVLTAVPMPSARPPSNHTPD